MTYLTEQQHALIWHKYMDLLKENQEKDLMILEKDETIARLRRELITMKKRVARLEQMVSPEIFLRTH